MSQRMQLPVLMVSSRITEGEEEPSNYRTLSAPDSIWKDMDSLQLTSIRSIN